MSRELPDHVRRNRADWDRNAGRCTAELIALLRESGVEIEELVEIRPPDGSTNVYHPDDALQWAQRWPCEEVWKARRR